MFIAGCGAANAIRRDTPRLAADRFSKQPFVSDVKGPVVAVVVLTLAVAMAVSLWFATSLGYHVLAESVSYFVNPTGPESVGRIYSSLRTDPHYGGRYLYIGYVTQFKDYLLPAVTILWLTRAAVRNHFLDWSVVFFLLPANLYFLTITGKRSKVLVFAFMVLIVLTHRLGVPASIVRHSAKIRSAVRVMAVGALTLFSGITVLRGWISTEAPIAELLLSPFTQLWWRMATGLAEAKLQLMEVLFTQPITWGRDWWRALLTIAPGHELGSANEFHEILYGSATGAVGLQVWESAWVNFGWFGVAIVGALLGFALQLFTFRFFRGEREATRTVLFLLLGLQLGSFSEPYGLVAGGTCAVAALYVLIRVIKHFSPKPTVVRLRRTVLQRPASDSLKSA